MLASWSEIQPATRASHVCHCLEILSDMTKLTACNPMCPGSGKHGIMTEFCGSQVSSSPVSTLCSTLDSVAMAGQHFTLGDLLHGCTDAFQRVWRGLSFRSTVQLEMTSKEFLAASMSRPAQPGTPPPTPPPRPPSSPLPWWVGSASSALDSSSPGSSHSTVLACPTPSPGPEAAGETSD